MPYFEVIPLKVSKPMKPGDSIYNMVCQGLADIRKYIGYNLRRGDIVAVTSKVVSYEQQRCVPLNAITPSAKAKAIGADYKIDPRLVALILDELHDDDIICCGVDHVLLTVHDGMLTANAGIDNKNAPIGVVTLWPKSPDQWAARFRDQLMMKNGFPIGVMVTDSSCIPLRTGTLGVALATSGFMPVKDHRGTADLFGKTIQITQNALAQNLASAAHLMMGESTELTPAVLIRGAPVEMCDRTFSGRQMAFPVNECMYFEALKRYYRGDFKKYE